MGTVGKDTKGEMMKKNVKKTMASMKAAAKKDLKHFLFEKVPLVNKPLKWNGKVIGKMISYDEKTGEAKFELSKSGEKLIAYIVCAELKMKLDVEKATNKLMQEGLRAQRHKLKSTQQDAFNHFLKQDQKVEERYNEG